MNPACRRLHLQHIEHAAAHGAGFDLRGGGLAHIAHGQVQAQGHAGQRVVGVEHDVSGVDLGHGVELVQRHVGCDAAFGETLELHARLEFGGEQGTLLKANQGAVELAEGVLGLEVQVRMEADRLPRQGLFHLRQEVIAADVELNRVDQFVKGLVLCIGQLPRKGNDARFFNQHLTMMAQRDNLSMDLHQAQPLLGGMSPAQFMRRHWQKRPLRVVQAIAGIQPPLSRADLFALAASDEVESRLIQRDAVDGWRLRAGPLPRRALPPLGRPGWTLLVQGLELHVDAAQTLLSRFQFLPAVRLDDLMLSYASDGGGVGPHIDSYDVFLLQVQGSRRWRVGRNRRPALRDDVPLKMLARFDAEHDWVLEAGDMLYLPPGWAHEGVAIGGDCMTASIGFRAPQAGELAQALLARMADEAGSGRPDARYRDAAQPATITRGAVPEPLQKFARRVVARALASPDLLERTLGEWLTEPKAQVWYAACELPILIRGLRLDRRSRMAYDARHVFINGDSWRASGRDARLLRVLADQRRLGAEQIAAASPAALDLLGEWMHSGWLQPLN